MNFKPLMIRVAEMFPLPETAHSVENCDKMSGPWTTEYLEQVLYEIHEMDDEFQFDKTNRRDGFRVWCPGNTDDGWPDGNVHHEPYSHVNDSTIVYIDDGWPCFVCKHTHCAGGMATPKKKWRDFIEFWYPQLDSYESLCEVFEIDEDPPVKVWKHHCRDQKGDMYSDDGRTWFDEQGNRI